MYSFVVNTITIIIIHVCESTCDLFWSFCKRLLHIYLFKNNCYVLIFPSTQLLYLWLFQYFHVCSNTMAMHLFSINICVSYEITKTCMWNKNLKNRKTKPYAHIVCVGHHQIELQYFEHRRLWREHLVSKFLL